MHGDASPPPDALDDALRDRLRTLTADRIADAVYWCRADGSFAWVNEGACRALGYRQDELLHMGVLDIDPAYERSSLAAFMDAVRTQGRVVFRTRNRRKDGTDYPVEIAAEHVALAGRDYVCAVARDLTERNEAEARLRRHAAQLEERQRFIGHMLDTSPDVLWVYDFVDRRTLYMSGQFGRMMGYDPDEVVAMGGMSLPRLVHPDDYAAYLEKILPRYATLKDGEVVHLVFRAKHRNGSWRLLHAREVIHARQPDGTPTQVFGLARDVTDERAADLRYRSLLKASIDGFWIYDAEGRFREVNDAYCRLLGYTRDEILALRIPDLEAVERPEETAAHIARILEAGHDRFETRHRAKDGRVVDVEVSVQLIPNSGGLAIAFLRDITERKQAEAARQALANELERRSREMEQMLYVSSHDLRSPLLNIQGFGSVLEHDLEDLRDALDGVPLPPDVRDTVDRVLGDTAPEALSFIGTGVQRMDALLSGLLTVSRAGRIAVDPAHVRMDGLVAEVLADLAFRVRAQGVEVVAGPLPDCHADRALVSQVFTNLLDNALKYLDPSRPGRIEVGGRVDGDQCVYEVRDNGVGIAPQHAERVFEMFHRLEPRQSKGEGIGLTIVRTLVERQGGRVWLESRPGEGCRFLVALPARPPQADRAAWPRPIAGGEA